MPISDFRWLQADDISNLHVEGMSDEQNDGYILEVDLDYPENLHETHNSFPLAPEQLEIDQDMLSPYAKGDANIFFADCGVRTHDCITQIRS